MNWDRKWLFFCEDPIKEVLESWSLWKAIWRVEFQFAFLLVRMMARKLHAQFTLPGHPYLVLEAKGMKFRAWWEI